MDKNYFTRRRLLKSGAALLGLSLFPSLSSAASVQSPNQTTSRILRIKALNTNESIESAYFVNGRYVPRELERLSHLFRDHRTDETLAITPTLFDQLYEINKIHGLQHRLLLICGYRSPETNTKLRGAKRGVAEKSLHMVGQAADFRLEGVELSNVLQTALSMNAGGVGYYPKSNFIHVDTGTTRFWPRAEITKVMARKKSA